MTSLARGLRSRLATAAVENGNALEARNVDQVLEAGNDVYQVCEDCHKVYLPQPK